MHSEQGKITETPIKALEKDANSHHLLNLRMCCEGDNLVPILGDQSVVLAALKKECHDMRLGEERQDLLSKHMDEPISANERIPAVASELNKDPISSTAGYEGNGVSDPVGIIDKVPGQGAVSIQLV